MGDFFQNGVITTLHALGRQDPGRLERELQAFTRERPLALVLPSLSSELQGTALPRILDRLQGVGYLREIVVSLGGADPAQFREAVR
ncbi:MAG: glycosyl transferase, partial [Deferrisomatales bacterium]